MRKVIGWSLFLYVGFALFIYWYLFGWNHELILTCTKEQCRSRNVYECKRAYAKPRLFAREKFTVFLATPLEWIILLFVLVLGISKSLRNGRKRRK